MSREFEDKKLLILGGNPETTPLVEIANNMGIKTIVSSARHSDPAKKAAWKAFDIDGMDVSGLVALAQIFLFLHIVRYVKHLIYHVMQHNRLLIFLHLKMYLKQHLNAMEYMAFLNFIWMPT